MSFAPCGSAFQVLWIGSWDCRLFHLCSLGYGIP